MPGIDFGTLFIFMPMLIPAKVLLSMVRSGVAPWAEAVVAMKRMMASVAVSRDKSFMRCDCF